MAADIVYRHGYLHYLLLQGYKGIDVTVSGGIVHTDIQLGEHVRTTVDAAVSTHDDKLARHLLWSA